MNGRLYRVHVASESQIVGSLAVYYTIAPNIEAASRAVLKHSTQQYPSEDQVISKIELIQDEFVECHES